MLLLQIVLLHIVSFLLDLSQIAARERVQGQGQRSETGIENPGIQMEERSSD